MNETVSITALSTIPDISSGDDLCEILCDCLEREGLWLENGDIVCIAHKVFSKAEGSVVCLSEVSPSPKAQSYAKDLNKDPRKVEVILRESKRVVRSFRHDHQNEGTIICEHKLGFISANAGVDESNVEGSEMVLLLPKDPDRSALEMKLVLEKKFGVFIGVVITDTFGRPWRIGQVNFAIGIAGIPATRAERGNLDAYGRKLMITEPAFCDEIAAAAGLIVRKAAKTPVVILKGLDWKDQKSATSDILRLTKEDMFL